MRVYILTDLEGVTGVTMWKQTGPANPEAYNEARRLLMGDVNAAVEGCLEGGATRITVLDGHGCPYNMVPELMHPRAEYICGRGFPKGWGMDGGYDLGMQVGAHAMNRTPDGVLYHAQNHTTDARYWYNGRETGELGQGALVMGHYGFPCVFVTGDEAACREAVQFFGEDCVTVAVKKGYGRQCASLLAPEQTRQLIRAGARQAMQRGHLLKPFTLELPIAARVETLEQPVADDVPLAEVVNLPHRVHEGTCPSALEIYSF
ncbi:MAG: M55 family metallopeptidase [Candidatus Latescibacterota bacterium]|jgi:D-amino peptidase